MILCAFDLLHIQAYVFRSNRLRDVMGGSLLVQDALRTWLPDLLTRDIHDGGLGLTETATPQAFFAACSASTQDPSHGLSYYLPQAAGGNALLLVPAQEVAGQVLEALSQRILEDAPGLTLAAATVEMDADSCLNDLLDLLKQRLEARKQTLALGSAPEFPGVLARCSMTRAPATRLDRLPGEGERWISPEVHARRTQFKRSSPSDAWKELHARADRQGADRLLDAIHHARKSHFTLSTDVEKLCSRRLETRYLGVLHLDANDLGQTLRTLPSLGRQEDLLRHHQLSEHLETAALDALGQTLDWLMTALEAPQPLPDTLPRLDLSAYRDTLEVDEEGWKVLPIRPILLAGDDLTLLVEGTLAPDFAAVMAGWYTGRLRAFRYEGSGPLARMAVSAGVGLGHAKKPFAQLYAAAEQACATAKQLARARKQSAPTDQPETTPNPGFLGLSFLEDTPEQSDRAWTGSLFGIDVPTETPTGKPAGTPHVQTTPSPSRALELPQGWMDFRKQVLCPIQEAQALRGQLHALARALQSPAPSEAVTRLRQLWRNHGVKERDIFAYMLKNEGRMWVLEGSRAPDINSPYLDALSLNRFVLPLLRGSADV